ncbi:hypothetical protein JCM15764A_32790 [Geotalea toluenoxydans]
MNFIAQKFGKISCKVIPLFLIFGDAKPKALQSLNLHMIEVATAPGFASGTPSLIGLQHAILWELDRHISLDVEQAEGFDGLAAGGDESLFLSGQTEQKTEYPKGRAKDK